MSNIMTKKRPILVTGSHRSGTTWVGKMLGFSPEIGYVWEPFNKRHRPGIFRPKFDVWYPFVDEHNAHGYLDAMEDLLSFNYSLRAELQEARTVYDMGRMLRDFVRFGWFRLQKRRPLLKDPMAFFSADWLARTFEMQVIILIRHPAAFASSLKIKNWHFPFEHFLKQPNLLDNTLFAFKDEIISYSRQPRDLIDQACLLWRMIYSTAYSYQEKHPDWLYFRHEDLSLDPENMIAALYDSLQLDFTREIETKIYNYTGMGNPIEQVSSRSVRRNSRENISNWKNRLEKAEIKRVFEATKDVASLWYPNEGF